MEKNLKRSGLRGSLLLGAPCLLLACGSVEPPADTAGGDSSGILTQGVPSTGAEGTADGSGADGSQSGGSNPTGGSQTSGAEESGDGPKFDLGIQPDLPGQGACEPGVGKGGKKVEGPDFSYLWAANSSEGTATA